ncbi:hypothetical protein AVEN_227060-1 [Araneus ventricosus]|uniref:Reverse transcriptase domain-containing protein n=1 Tax=Araneus ventricosus TaxID=182803 RepID=A0A4Y2LBA4_ARAVE|nr:hypothetical protein AVEN_227060-1 [Araneus ventricosus]
MAAASSDECVDIFRKVSDNGHMFTYQFVLKDLGDKGSWIFQEEFQTKCESGSSSWLCKMQFRKVSDNNIASIRFILRRTDKGKNVVYANIYPFIKDSAERRLFNSKAFDLRNIIGGEAIVEDLVENIPFPDKRMHFNRELDTTNDAGSAGLPVRFSGLQSLLVNKDQVDYQRIFWSFSPTEPVKSYRLLTVTYGTACAPFLAIRTLLQLAQDYEKLFPDKAKVIRENFYVDDLLTGADSVPKARRLVKDLIQVMGMGGFTIRKWACNDIRVVSVLPSELKSLELDAGVEDKWVKLLGLFSSPSRDMLKLNISTIKSVTTKRELLSASCKYF